MATGAPWLIAATAALALGMADAGARGGGGFGGGGSFGGGAGGGVMAQSSVAGANRSIAAGGDAGGDRSGVGSAGANRADRNIANRDRRNPDINAGNNVNRNLDGGFGNNAGRIEHPIAAGIVIGRIGVTTGGVAGTYYYSLPSAGCTNVNENGVDYILCTSVYYQEVWSGNEIVYVVVNP
jgi:hypothetical protein